MLRLLGWLALVPAAPAAQDSTAAIPELGARVTRIRFFEGARAMPAMLNRQYGTRFDSAATRSVYVEIGLAYPPATHATAVKVECGIVRAGGAAAGTAIVDVQADAGWELSVHAGGTGADVPGSWIPGAHQVSCRYAGKVIASGAFEVTRAAAAPAPPPPPPPRTTRAPPRGTPPAAPAPDPNAKAPATLSGTAVGPLKARVTGVRFFESGADVPERKDRVLSTTFDALTTRFINMELDLEYPRAPRALPFEFACRFDGPDSTARTPTVRGPVEPGWVGSYHTTGWGARNRGMWPEGSYKVTCTGEGKVVVVSEFKVVKARAAVEALGASLTHVRFFQSAGERLPVEVRRYGARFDSRAARWIKTEFGLVYPAVPAPVSFTVTCKYNFPDGTQRTVSAERRVPAGWTGSVHVQGLGAEQPGAWPAGTYQVTCASEGRDFASGSFEVADADPPPTQGAVLRMTPASGDASAADTVMIEVLMPSRATGDSTAFRCTLTDPAGIASAFALEGEARDRVVRGAGAIPGLEPPRLRGTYRVDCRVGARALVAERFEVGGSADLAAADTRLQSAALFEGADAAPDDEAVPDVAFSIARLRALWLVAILDHPTDRGAPGVPYACKLSNARNAVIAESGAQTLAIAPGDRLLVLRQRLQLAPRQRWTPGRYTLACASGTAPFVRTSVELTR